MEEKVLLKKKTGSGEIKDNLLSNTEYFINNGDNLMVEHNQLKKQVLEVESSLKSFKEIRQGDKK